MFLKVHDTFWQLKRGIAWPENSRYRERTYPYSTRRMLTISLQHSTFHSVCPWGQIEQLACSRFVSLHGLSDQAVTLRRLRVDKHKVIQTDTHAHRHGREQHSFTVLRFFLVGGAESRGISPWQDPAGRGQRRLVTHAVLSFILFLSGFSLYMCVLLNIKHTLPWLLILWPTVWSPDILFEVKGFCFLH